jgi:hypothetical protein
MTRWFAVLGCALALSIIAPIGFDTGAAARGVVCKATGLDGKQSKWRCKAGHKCCFNWLTNKPACASASSICL